MRASLELHDGRLGARLAAPDLRPAHVQTLFAVNDVGRPVGVAVFVRLEHARFVVLHVVVEPKSDAAAGPGNSVLLRLMHEIRRAARITRGVDRIELVYKHAHSARRQSNRI